MVDFNLTIDDELHKLQIPNSWDDVTVGMYEALASINREGITELQYSIELICALVGMDKELIYLMPVEEMPKITEHLQFASSPLEDTQVDSIVINNEEYFLKKEFDKLNLGEMTSLNILSDKYKDNVESALGEMLCIFLRKKKENGKLEAFRNEFMDRAEMFRDNVLIKDVHSLFVFFLNGDKK